MLIFTVLHGMQTWSSDENSLCPSPSICPSVRPSVRLSNACVVTKRKKDMSRFLYHTKDHLTSFSEKKNGCWGRPLLPEILGQLAPVGVDPKFQVEGAAPTNHSASQKTRVTDLSYGIKSADFSSVLSKCTRLTDRRTDRQNSHR